jgi:phosphatidylglycerol lysyltransferase
MGFLVHVEPFTFPAFRRCFVAQLEGKLVAFAGVIPVPARRGWFIEDMVRSPDAPNGTGELLTDAVMQWAAAADCDWLTLGLAPLAGDVTGLLRAARTSSSLFFDFEGLRRYKAKLRPDTWSPIFVSYPPGQSSVRTMMDVLVAFSREGLLRFGVRTLLRGPSGVLTLLAVLLVGWIGLLVVMPSDPWFAAPWEKWAWIAFDVFLAGGLFRLARQPNRTLASILAVGVSCDAVITLWRALSWNLPRSSGAGYTAVVVIACMAPMIAAAALWGARSTRLRIDRSDVRVPGLHRSA